MQFVESMAGLVKKAMMRLSAGERMSDRAQRALGVLKSFRVTWSLPEDAGDLTLGIDPVAGQADSGLLDEDLAGLFLEVGELAKNRDVGVLFTIDEIQYLSKEDLSALIVGVHRVNQERLPFMVAGGGLPSIAALAGEAKSYAERLFRYELIGSLAAAEAGIALTGPAEEEEVQWQGDALDRVVELTAGYPYFLQEYGKQVWDIAAGPDEITLVDVERAIPVASDELDTGFFRVRIDRTTDSERTYLAAMASFGAGPYGSGAVASEQAKTTAQVGPVRDTLIKKGLIYGPRYGVVDFTVPMFDEFLRRWLDE